MSSLQIVGLSHRFDDQEILDEVSLHVARGEVHCLLGPSGSGKSTLLRLVAGLETRQTGQISIDGLEVAGPETDIPPEARAVGFVFQDYALFPHLDVLDNVLFGMAGTSDARRAAALELLGQVEMARFARSMPHTLSGGEQQRVALARALARQPRIMLLDEPFSGLDASLRESVRTTTLEVLRAASVATLMVTHDPQEALKVADRISVIRSGRVLQTGTPRDLYERSKSVAVAEMFGPINSFAAVVDQGRITTDWGEIDAQGVADGTEMTVMIRPEAIGLTSVAADDPRCEARIVSAEREGALARLRVRNQTFGEFIVFALADQCWHAGDQVELTVRTESMMIVDQAMELLSTDRE